MKFNQSLGAIFRVLGGAALVVVSMHSEAQFQSEPKSGKAVQSSNQITRTPVKPSVVYAPASEVTRKFFYEVRFYEVLGKNLDSATFLLQQGADINCQVCTDTITHPGSGRTLLMLRAGEPTKNGSSHQILPWLVNNGANAKLMDAAGNSVLHHVFSPWSEFVNWPGIRGNLRFFLSLGIDPKVKNNSGDTALHIFAKNAKLLSNSGTGDVADYASFIAELTNAGANIDEQNVAGRTPLMMSLRQCSLPIARSYLHAGASANIKDAAGQGLPEIARANAIQSPTKECIEVANFFANPQNIESINTANSTSGPGAMVTPTMPLPNGNFPKTLVSDFQGVIKSSLQTQPFSAKGKIDESGHFEYGGDNGVVMTGSFDASGSEIEGHGVTRLPVVSGRQLTYPNGESEARVALLARFDGQILRGSYMSKFEKGTFALCLPGVTSVECTVTADPLGALFKGIGGLLKK